jgi:Tol biopolymer transport system component
MAFARRLSLTPVVVALALGDPSASIAATSTQRCDGAERPELFTPTRIPDGIAIDAATFSRDGATVFFDEQADRGSTIMISHRKRGRWFPPEVASFSGASRDLDPAMAPDNSFLIFSSNRSAVPSGPPLDAVSFAGTVNLGMGGQLWRVDRLPKGGWSRAVRLPDAVNDGTRIFSPSVAADGSVYFQKPDPVSRTFHLYRSQFRDGRYEAPVPVAIGPESADERDPAIAPDESFLVFSANSRGKGQPNRLQIVFRKGHNWGAPIDLGDDVNREGAQGPHLGPDRCTIYYDRNGRIWRVSLASTIAGHRAARIGPRPDARPDLFAAARAWPAGTDATPAFTPDGSTVFFTHALGERRTIMVSRLRDGRWSAPAPAPFSGIWRDIEPAMAPDGSYLVFISNRPATMGAAPLDGYFGGQARPRQGGALWRVDRDGDGWSEPVRLPDIVNSDPSTYSPAVAGDGSIYFNRPDPVTRKSHIYWAQAEVGGFRSPEPLPMSDGTVSDFDAAVAPDQSFIMFSSPRPPAKPGTAILFVTYRRSGGWTPPQPLGAGIQGYEARLSPDLKTLYFSADAPAGPANGDRQSRIYQIPLQGLIDNDLLDNNRTTARTGL